MIGWVCAFLLLASSAVAQVVVDPDRSDVRDGWFTLEIDLGLTAVTPYRAFTLDAPRRLVVDFQDVTFHRLNPDTILSGDRASAVRFGPLRPGWSRMVVDLAKPLVIREAGMTSRAAGADLRIVMERASAEQFAARAGAPPDPGWEAAMGFDPITARQIARSGDFVVVLDPGHGGIDPGASQGGIKEADLMLLMAEEIALTLNGEDGVHAVLTRQQDNFVPLAMRLTIARQVGADLFISLHADASEQDAAQGASVYTLSAGGGEAAAQRSVERHERGDILAGVDLTAAEDRVATALMDLARDRTGPAGQRFADALVASMQRAGVAMNARPRRQAQFVVLSAADFPSVLVEAGFLSNAQDSAVLATYAGRARISQAIRDAVVLMAR